jgi:glutamate/aspartate transport system permease protein
MAYQWDWGVLVREPYFGWLLEGIKWTALISALAYALALTIGIFVGVLRTLPSPTARMFGAVYVQTFRSVPLLVQLFLWYFVVPEVLPESAGTWLKRGLPYPEYWTTAIGLGLFMGARIAEQTRAAIGAAGAGMHRAAMSQGFTQTQIYRHMLLPVGLRYALPPFTSEFLNTVKNSSLALTIGMLELTGQSRQIEAYTFRGIEAFTAATLVYVLVSLIVIGASRALEGVLHVRGTDGGRT